MSGSYRRIACNTSAVKKLAREKEWLASRSEEQAGQKLMTHPPSVAH
jgi:hypothetical protein